MPPQPSSRTQGAALLAAAGLAALSPMQIGAALLVAGTAFWASPALAQSAVLPGAAVIITAKDTDRTILAPADANGEVRINDMPPGDYEAMLIGTNRSTTAKVGNDRRLALRAHQRQIRTSITPGGKVGQRSLTQRMVTQIPFDGAGRRLPENAVVFNLRQSFSESPPIPCAFNPSREKLACGTIRYYIDVNASTAAQIAHLAPQTAPAAAEELIAERTRGGRFKSVRDFVSRVCSRTTINFGVSQVRIGDFRMLAKRDGDPNQAGFKCKAGDNMFLLYAAWFSNSGRDFAGWRDPFEIRGVGEDSRPD